MTGIHEDIVTGYEETFDWVPYEGTPRPYLLATVPRSGSTYFSHLLWATGCLGAPLEYLNFEPTGPFGAVHGSPEAQTALWQRVLARRTSPNGIFGLKAFPLQLELLGQHNPPLLADTMRFFLAGRSNSKVIQLRRRDRAAHAISLARASLKGVWRQEQESDDQAEPAYSAAMVERAERELAVQEDAWTAMCRDLSITPLVLWYEDVVADPGRAIDAAADYLGVILDPQAAIEVPKIRQQSQQGAQAWKRRHASE